MELWEWGCIAPKIQPTHAVSPYPIDRLKWLNGGGLFAGQAPRQRPARHRWAEFIAACVPLCWWNETQMALPKPSNVVDWQGLVCISTHRLARKIAPRRRAGPCATQSACPLMRGRGVTLEQPVICGMMMRRRLQDRLCSRTMNDAALMNGQSVASYLQTACPKPRHAASPWLI